MSLDGQSDISDVFSRLVTFLGNVLRGRLQSLSQYHKTKPKLNNLVNLLLSMIPDEIDIPGTSIYTEGGISDKFHIEAGKYMIIPLDLSIQSHSYPMSEINNTAVFGPFAETGYEMQLYLSDYFVESLLWALYYEDLIQLHNLPIDINTSELNIVFLGKLTRHGFSVGMPCVIDSRAID